MAALMRFGPLSLVGVLALGIVAGAVAAPGDLDPTFGTGGRVGLSPYVESVGVAAVLQPDGKILLAGWADDVAPPPPPPPAPFGLQASNADFLAVRLTPNGSLDLPFGRDGTVRTPIDLGNSTGDFAWAVAPGPDGTVAASTSRSSGTRPRARSTRASPATGFRRWTTAPSTTSGEWPFSPTGRSSPLDGEAAMASP